MRMPRSRGIRDYPALNFPRRDPRPELRPRPESDPFFPELAPTWSEPSKKAMDVLLRWAADVELRELPAPAVLLSLYGEPIDLTF